MTTRTKTMGRLVRKQDLPAGVEIGAVSQDPTSYVAPPAPHLPDPPENLDLDTGMGRNSQTPMAEIYATWDPPWSVRPEQYMIQYGKDSGFPAGSFVTTYAYTDSATLRNVDPGTTYYVRIASVYRGITGSFADTVSILTATDLIAPAQPSGGAVTFVGTGDALITFTNPNEERFKWVEITIKRASDDAIMRVVTSSVGRFLYTIAMNKEDSGGGFRDLKVELRSVSWAGVTNNVSPPTVLATKAKPATPTVAHSWSGETDHNGTAAADLTFTLTLSSDTAKCLISLNGQTAREIYGTVYTYPYARNVADNGTPGDPTLTYNITAVDGLGQTSNTAATGTATNEDPPMPTVSLVVGFSILIATVGGTQAADFAAYEYVWKRDGTIVRTLLSKAAEQQYELSGAADSGFHSWTVEVRQQDLFGQYSTAVVSSAQAFEGFTIAGLRDLVEYSDSEGTAAATLKAALADGNTTSGGISYNP